MRCMQRNKGDDYFWLCDQDVTTGFLTSNLHVSFAS